MDISIPPNSQVKSLDDLTFCEKFKISLNRVQLNSTDGEIGITQKQFAELIGVSNSSISKVCLHDGMGRGKTAKKMKYLIDLVCHE